MPTQSAIPKNNMPVTNSNSMRQSIANLLTLGAIQTCTHDREEFISKIFLRPKPNGKFRFILNLKPLNKFIKVEHFKMEDIRTAIKIIDKDYYMCSIDLKEAYFLVPVSTEHRKYLRFVFEDTLYQFTALPYGLCTAPSTFTKLLKPVVSYLRRQGFLSTIYLDDYLCIGSTFEECVANRDATLHIFQCLGLIVNYEKSTLTPETACKFLGFIINSHSMTLELPQDKQISIKTLLSKFMKQKNCKIREFAKLLGTLVAACPAVPYGPVHLKIMERERYLALLHNKDNFNAVMNLPDKIQPDLKWWLSNINSPKSIVLKPFILEIFSDASLTGWGIHCNGESVGGLWSQSEQTFHINQLELLAALFGLKCFAKLHSHCNILLRIDNTTAIACVNKMGSVQFPHLNNVAREVWTWCENRGINIYASYIKSRDNVFADEESRNTNIDTEWELNDSDFELIKKCFGTPHIDLFASRINKKCEMYVSWKRDPYAFDIDALTLHWGKYFFYAFPPFSLMTKCLQKIKSDKAKGILVYPVWDSQPWFPLAMSLMITEPVIFKTRTNLLKSPLRTEHPLSKHLTLAASVFCGEHSDAEVCQRAH